ncbi:MAG: malonate decarboxylase holo-[acyl-carrier-protein] synthase [Syntrophorhabdales bacterium]
MSWKRHTLVDVSDAGRRAILDELAGNCPGWRSYREKVARVLLPELAGARIPGIVRREDGPPREACVPVGFSDPRSTKGRRLRIAAFARLKDVAAVTSPYDVLSFPVPRRTASTAALEVAKAKAASLGLVMGVWGSAAMELYTGLPYIGQASDLDLIVAAAPREKLSDFAWQIESIGERFGLRIDVEVDLTNGYGVQLKELLGSGRTVLGKGISAVALFPRQQIVNELPQGDS